MKHSVSSEKLPKISIVTPSYNQGCYIEATINSVLNQQYHNIEYIVADGGSTDETIDILKMYEGRLKWISEKDQGPEDAIAKGFRMATGEVFGWLASDDMYEPDAIQKIMSLFIQDPELAMVYGRCKYVGRNGTPIGECPTEPFNYEYLAVYNIIAQPSAFFRRSAYEAVGGISLELKQASDYDLWIRMTKNRKTAYIPELLSSYRLHYAGKTLGFHDPCVKFEEYIMLTRKYYDWVPANRVYPFCLYRLRAKSWRITSYLVSAMALVYAVYEYLRLNKRIDSRDLALIPQNLKKLAFGWELEDTIKSHNDNL